MKLLSKQNEAYLLLFRLHYTIPHFPKCKPRPAKRFQTSHTAYEHKVNQLLCVSLSWMRNIWIHAVCGNDLLASCFKLEVLFSFAQIQKPNLSNAAIIFPPLKCKHLFLCTCIFQGAVRLCQATSINSPCVCVYVRLSARRFRQLVERLLQFISTRLFPAEPDEFPPLSKCSWWIPSATKVLSLFSESHTLKLLTSQESAICVYALIISVTFDCLFPFFLLRCSQQCLFPSNHALHWLLQHYPWTYRFYGRLQDLAKLRQLK